MFIVTEYAALKALNKILFKKRGYNGDRYLM